MIGFSSPYGGVGSNPTLVNLNLVSSLLIIFSHARVIPFFRDKCRLVNTSDESVSGRVSEGMS